MSNLEESVVNDLKIYKFHWGHPQMSNRSWIYHFHFRCLFKHMSILNSSSYYSTWFTNAIMSCRWTWILYKIYVLQTGGLGNLPTQSSHIYRGTLWNIDIKVANLPVKIGLIDIPLVAIAVDTVHIQSDHLLGAVLADYRINLGGECEHRPRLRNCLLARLAGTLSAYER